MKKTQYLFFDIDGTLIKEQNDDVPESARKALWAAQEKGHKLFINTGRTFCCVPRRLRDLVDGCLCGCGTDLYINGKQIFYISIPPEKCRELLEAATKYKVSIIFEGKDKNYIDKKSLQNPHFYRFCENCKAMGATIEMIQKNTKIVSEKFCFYKEQDSELEPFLQVLGNDFEVIERGGGLYEVLSYGRSKATAIEQILDYYGAEIEDSWAFGDSSNDLAMLRYVRHAVIMGQHDKVLEEYAEFITDTVEQNGLYNIMKQQELI